MQTLSLTRPDDWHVHLRDGDYLADTVRDLARYFGRAIIMPNLNPPVDSVELALAYFKRIRRVTPPGSAFTPLMTLYLRSNTTPETVKQAHRSGLIKALKLYPLGSTTNSEAGISVITSLYPVFEAMQSLGMVLCIHGEVTRDTVDIFDREARFIDESLVAICETFPALRVVFEHITTNTAVQFVDAANENLAATITAHHLLYNRNHMLVGGMKPLYYCLPVLKRSSHQAALIAAVASGKHKFFLGTDSAPHPRHKKENLCGCAAGSYTAHAAIELYAEAFEAAGALDKLEGFASFYGPDFYGLARNTDTITLIKQDWTCPQHLNFGGDKLVPLRAGEIIKWQLASKD